MFSHELIEQCFHCRISLLTRADFIYLRMHQSYVDLHLITCAQEGLSEDLRKGITDLAFLLDESIQATDLEVEMLGRPAWN